MPVTTFSDRYKEEAFYLWYENDKPPLKKFRELLPQNSDRQIPALATLQVWKDSEWEQRADALDGELSISLDRQVIQKRIAMFEEHEKVGKQLITKGKDFLEENGITTDASAIRAIATGVEIQRASVGGSEAWSKISQMTDGQLDLEYKRLLGKITKVDEETIEIKPDEVEE